MQLAERQLVTPAPNSVPTLFHSHSGSLVKRGRCGDRKSEDMRVDVLWCARYGARDCSLQWAFFIKHEPARSGSFMQGAAVHFLARGLNRTT